VFIRFCEVDWIRLSSEILQSGGWAGLQIPMVIAPLAITRRVQINWCLTHTCPVRGLRLDSHAFHESDTYVRSHTPHIAADGAHAAAKKKQSTLECAAAYAAQQYYKPTACACQRQALLLTHTCAYGRACRCTYVTAVVYVQVLLIV
jgi:hypothetical protein